LDQEALHLSLTKMIEIQIALPYVVIVLIFWRVSWRFLLAKSTAKETAIGDLIQFEKLSQRSGNSNFCKRKETCVIIGGGLAGCLTAAIMTHHYERVVIVEPASDKAKLRERTLQYHQVHAFGPLVIEALRVIWPDIFANELVKRGGRFYRFKDIRYQCQLNKCTLKWDERLAAFGQSGRDQAAFSRPEMQDLLVDLTSKHTRGIKYVYGKVTSVSYVDEGLKINKVHVTRNDCTALDNIDCDLVIDCSGNARAYRKLIKSNPIFHEPNLESYRKNVSYATALIDIDDTIVDQLPLPDEHSKQYSTWREASQILVVAPLLTQSTDYSLVIHTERNRCEFAARFLGTLVRILSDIRIVTDYIGAMTYNASQSDMPRTLGEYKNFVKGSYYGAVGREIGPWFDETIDLLQKNETITGEKVKFHTARDESSYITTINPNNRQLPYNLALVGDSYAKLNPAYGQGTAKAVMDALTLSTCLEQHANIEKAVKAFDKQRAPKSYGLFDFNRAIGFLINRNS
jgi:2-polyprenyl-6-methoxyphenol hydroxylase-like FAD-dependent oxidoreductase